MEVMTYMSEIFEEMVQGYCRTSDQPRILTFEYSKKNGENVLEYTDCAYGTCVHSKTCKLIEEMFQRIHIEK